MLSVLKPRVSTGILLFILVIALMVLVAAPLQYHWGMIGLAVTELMFLVFAVGFALLLKGRLKEVFPIKKPRLRQIFGVIVLWVGGYIAVIAANIVIAYFFPQEMDGVSNAMIELFQSLPYIVTFFIVAVMPAVCEEVLHRGLILYTFKNVQNKWIIVAVMGIIFGIFHLDPVRFLGTAILGAVLTYIMIETKNILLPMLLHFINNAFSLLPSLLITAPPVEMEIDVTLRLASVGILLLISAVAPFVFLGGSRLLLSKEDSRTNPISKRVLTITIVATVVLVVIGLGVTTVGLLEFMAEFPL